jgi:hypothetical protein
MAFPQNACNVLDTLRDHKHLSSTEKICNVGVN